MPTLSRPRLTKGKPRRLQFALHKDDIVGSKKAVELERADFVRVAATPTVMRHVDVDATPKVVASFVHPSMMKAALASLEVEDLLRPTRPRNDADEGLSAVRSQRCDRWTKRTYRKTGLRRVVLC